MDRAEFLRLLNYDRNITVEEAVRLIVEYCTIKGKQEKQVNSLIQVLMNNKSLFVACLQDIKEYFMKELHICRVERISDGQVIEIIKFY